MRQCPRVYNGFKEYEKKIDFKLFKVMKSTSKNGFSYYLLSNTFNGKFQRSHLDILNLSTQHNN